MYNFKTFAMNALEVFSILNADWCCDADLGWCDHSFILRLFVPSMLANIKMKGNNGRVRLDMKETFTILEDTHFLQRVSFSSIMD